MLSETNLFKPLKVGTVELSHRLVIAPLTRLRATEDHIPTDLMLKHYDDLTKTPGLLIITEATFVDHEAGGLAYVPGVYHQKHLEGWKKITDKIHENGSFVSIQLGQLGRAASPEQLVKENIPFKGVLDIYMDKESEEQAKKFNTPLTVLTTEEIRQWVKRYAEVSEKAIKQAGFDFIELHGAHGFFFDQFFLTHSNNRTDEYGGSIENRARFFLEVVDAVTERIGGERVGCRLSPFTRFQGMQGLDSDPNPYAQFGYIIGELEKRRKNSGFAYLSIVEPRANTAASLKEEEAVGSNEWVFDVFKGVVFRAGGYIKKSNPKDFSLIERDVNKNDRTVISLGEWTTSNPDIVEKLRNGWELTHYDRPSFYAPFNWNYNTWSLHGEAKTFDKKKEQAVFGKPLA